MVSYVGDAAEIPSFDPKDPSDVDVFRFDFRNRVGAATITARTVTVPDGITLDGDALSLSDQGVDATLSGGTAGQDYIVACKATLSDSRILEYSGIVPVRQR